MFRKLTSLQFVNYAWCDGAPEEATSNGAKPEESERERRRSLISMERGPPIPPSNTPLPTILFKCSEACVVAFFYPFHVGFVGGLLDEGLSLRRESNPMPLKDKALFTFHRGMQYGIALGGIVGFSSFVKNFLEWKRQEKTWTNSFMGGLVAGSTMDGFVRHMLDVKLAPGAVFRSMLITGMGTACIYTAGDELYTRVYGGDKET